MLRAILLFGAGWWFGSNRQAGQQVIQAGQALLDTAAQGVKSRAVLPNTTIISPEQAMGCPKGYTWWPDLKACLSPEDDAKARESYAKTGRY